MISAEFEFDCAGFVLTKKFNSSRARAVRPIVRNSLLLRKIP